MSEEILYTKKGSIRKRKPKQGRDYFNQETENAIIQYVKTTDMDERNKIYNQSIDYSFYKLSENIINNFGFDYMDTETVEDKIQELVAFMLGKMHLYDQTKGKAFSYFGTMAKRYMINDNEKNYQKAKNKVDVDDYSEFEESNNSYIREVINDQTSNSISEFIPLYIRYVDDNINKIFTKPKDLSTADAVMELFRKRETLDIFNKKALYIYIREIVDVDTPQITKIMKKLKDIYVELFNKYYELGHI